MSLIKPRSIHVEETVPGRAAKITFEPLERGYGTTVGNSLRRMLLSSLKGCAVTSVAFEGVLHEFDTIKGVREDVLDIILALKEIDIRMLSDKAVMVSLDVKGPAVVTAGDIKCPAGVQVLNTDLVLVEEDKLAITIEKALSAQDKLEDMDLDEDLDNLDIVDGEAEGDDATDAGGDEAPVVMRT